MSIFKCQETRISEPLRRHPGNWQNMFLASGLSLCTCNCFTRFKEAIRGQKLRDKWYQINWEQTNRRIWVRRKLPFHALLASWSVSLNFPLDSWQFCAVLIQRKKKTCVNQNQNKTSKKKMIVVPRISSVCGSLFIKTGFGVQSENFDWYLHRLKGNLGKVHHLSLVLKQKLPTHTNVTRVVRKSSFLLNFFEDWNNLKLQWKLVLRQRSWWMLTFPL